METTDTTTGAAMHAAVAKIGECVAGYKREHELITAQRDHLVKLYEELKRSPVRSTTANTEDYEQLLGITRVSIEDLDSLLKFIDTQTEMLKKAMLAFGSDDIEVVKAAAFDYLISDVEVSFKNLAMRRYDNAELMETFERFIREHKGGAE